MPLAGYVRVSRRGDRSGPSYISPDVQRDKIEGWARLHDVDLSEVVVEEDVSGSLRVEERALGELVERCERGELAGVVVYRLDRFGRNALETLLAVHRLREADARLVGVDDGVDSAKPGGKLVIAVLAALAEEQLDRIRATWRESQERAIARGIHFASTSPFGYRRGAAGRLVIVPELGPAIREAFLRRSEGATLSEIAGALTAVGGPRGARRWNHAAVKRMLANRVYLGEARYGSFARADAHPAIVSEAEFRHAQREQMARSPLRHTDGALLAGILRCAGCRYAMQRTVPQRRGARLVRDYRCRRTYTTGLCPDSGAIRAEKVESFVVERFLEAISPDGILARSLPDDRRVVAARDDLERAEQELEAYVEAVSVADLGRALYLSGLRARESAQREARAELDELLSHLSRPLPHTDELRGLWSGLSVEERRRILAGGIDCVFLRRGGRAAIEDRVLILWRGEGPRDLPRRGISGPLGRFDWPDDLPATAVAVAQHAEEGALDSMAGSRR